MRILIRGGGFQNKGAEAMLRVVQRELSMRIPEASFHATVSPSEIPYANRVGIWPVGISQKPLMRLMRSVPILSNKLEIELVGDVDAVIDVSGFAYGDSWNTRYLKNAWNWVDYCHLKKRPYIFMPQAWGKFEKKEIAFWTRKICSASDFVFARDNESSKHLARLQAVSVDEVRSAPDIAFRFHGAPSAVGRTILHNLGLETSSERPLVALVPNLRIYERTSGKGASNKYVSHLVQLANYCIEGLGANLLLMPNEIRVPSSNGLDDRFLCGIIESRIRKMEHCFTFREYCSSETVKSIIGHADLLIASRFHSLVFGLSKGIPVLALGWSHKYQELLKPFDMEDFVVDHDRLDTNSVTALLQRAWAQKMESSKRILKIVPQLQKEIDLLFDEIADALREANH